MRAAAHKPTGRAASSAALIAALLLLIGVLAPAAQAAPAQLWQSCETGSAAGQCDFPRGVAADPNNGRVFVADQVNSRIDVFNALGAFIRAWGGDVVASGPGNTGSGFEVCEPERGDTCKAGSEGEGAGRFHWPQGVAVDSAGNVYVVDGGLPSNQRVQKFTPTGQFLFAWGGDVVFDGPDDSANNEEQELTIAATSGSFRLGLPHILDGGAREETPPLPFNASAAEVKAALDALPTIGGLGGSVSVTGGPGDASGSTPYTVSFEGKLAGDNVPQLSVAIDVGSQLKCSSSTAAETISYQWLRDSQAIEGATASTYTAVAADKGKSIQCRVTATNANAGSIQVSEPGQAIAPAAQFPAPSHPAPIAAPEASAPLTVGGAGGQTLSCKGDEAGWKGLRGAINFSWYRNGTQIKDASSSTYKVTAADLASAAVFQCEVIAGGGFEGLDAVKVSANLATAPAPSAPPAPEAQASISPANGVTTSGEGGEHEVCKPADECKAGSEGAGDGEFGEWAFGSFIAIDTAGSETAADDKVYVGDENRIQSFDAEGAYQGQFAVPGTVQSLAVDLDGNLYAVYSGEIHKFSSSGAPLTPEVFSIPKLVSFENPSANAVAVDAAGHVYGFGPTTSQVSSGAQRNPIVEFDAAGNVIDEFGKGEFEGSTGLATNLCAGSEAPGNLYATNASQSKGFLRAYGTEPNGCFKALTGAATAIAETSATLNGTVNPRGTLSSECRFKYGTTTNYGSIAPCAESPAAIGEGTDPVPVHANLSGLTKGTVYHFQLLAKIKGETETGPDREFKTLGPPVISGDHVLSAAYSEATLKALVNPEGFATTYRFQYTTEDEFEADGFEGAESTDPIAVGSDRKDHAVLVDLSGLTPGTSYRWRVLAVNSSGETEGQTRAFATYRQPVAETECPNQAFRTAASAPLPDCRAYELVSPLDKNGADIVSAMSGAGDPGGYVQSSLDGDRLTYTVAFASFAGAPASFKFNQYLSARGAGGWSSEGIDPPMPGHLCCGGSVGLYALTRHFSAFSPDLCSAWLYDAQAPALLPDAQQGSDNLYRRQNCGAGAGGLEAVTSAPLALPAGTNYVGVGSVQGLSGDTRHAVFVASAKLTSDASTASSTQIYDRFEGANHLVSVLPGGQANATGAAVGNFHNLVGAVSAEGSLVYWTAGAEAALGNGKLYVRRNPEQGIVADECANAAKACTLPVSIGSNASFRNAAVDGSKALYSQGEDLFEFDLRKAEAEEPPRRLIAHNVGGVAGASEDLARVYFVSTDALPGSGQNSEGDEAQAGEHNLYLDEGGAMSFVATLIKAEVEGKKEPGADDIAYAIEAREPYFRPTRVTPDGSRIVFEARAPLTGYDNTDPESGKPAVEVFSYQAGGELVCISCNPSGASPSGVRELRIPYSPIFETNSVTNVPAAAWIPTWEHKLHASNVLSEDGSRIFFNSNDALIPRDINGAQDVYQWEAAGAGGCSEESPSYLPQNGGCLDLISSGESPDESEFREASPDGKDVFFATSSSLLPQDPGLVDIYDARVGGGFPQPVKASACEGEACQGPPKALNDPTPASAAFRGAGSPKQGGTKPRRCPKGKRQVRRKGKAHCAPKRQKRANHKGRASR